MLCRSVALSSKNLDCHASLAMTVMPITYDSNNYHLPPTTHHATDCFAVGGKFLTPNSKFLIHQYFCYKLLNLNRLIYCDTWHMSILGVENHITAVYDNASHLVGFLFPEHNIVFFTIFSF